jgi:hypothetical protein
MSVRATRWHVTCRLKTESAARLTPSKHNQQWRVSAHACRDKTIKTFRHELGSFWGAGNMWLCRRHASAMCRFWEGLLHPSEKQRRSISLIEFNHRLLAATITQKMLVPLSQLTRERPNEVCHNCLVGCLVSRHTLIISNWGMKIIRIYFRTLQLVTELFQCELNSLTIVCCANNNNNELSSHVPVTASNKEVAMHTTAQATVKKKNCTS